MEMNQKIILKAVLLFCICLLFLIAAQSVDAEEIPATKDNIEVVSEPQQQNIPDIPQTTDKQPSDDLVDTESVNQDTNSDTSFPFGNIIKSIVDPMFEESGKTNIEDAEIEITEVTEVEQNETAETNVTSVIVEVPIIDRDANKTEKKTKFKCVSRNMTLENVTSEVKIINNTRLLQILNFEVNDTLSDCVLVMFYAPWCRFCSKVAPNYNALARAFPELDVVAVDAAHFSNLNARFGTVSVPNILLFHQSRAVVRFNQTDKQFENLVSFVKNHTGMEPYESVNVTDSDYIGPLPSVPSDETDYLLWISWLFVIIFISVVFVRSSYGQHYINKVKILWQEHQHID